MDNFMDRLVERMNDRGHGPDSDMPGSDNRFSGSDNRYSGGDRMDYSGQDDSYGYGRSQRQSAPSIGRRDLDELGRAIISAQKQMADNQSGQLSDNARMIDAMRGALLDQAKGLDEGFKEQNEKIDASAEKILKAIQEGKPAGGRASSGDDVSREYLAQILDNSSASITERTSEAIHKEDVKLYKNIQAVIDENTSKITGAVTEGSKKTTDSIASSLAPLSQLERINELEASLAETKEEILNRTSGLKSKITVTLLLTVVNFIGIAVLVAIAFGFL